MAIVIQCQVFILRLRQESFVEGLTWRIREEFSISRRMRRDPLRLFPKEKNVLQRIRGSIKVFAEGWG